MPLAVRDLSDLDPLDAVSRHVGIPLRPLVVPEPEIRAAINRAYEERSGEAEALIESLDRDSVLGELEEVARREDLLETSSRAPVIRLVNLLLFEAVKLRASDVHIQPYEEDLCVRLRIDGILFDVYRLAKGFQEEILSRVKIIGHMNIAGKRLAQDGRATVRVGERLVDLRISSVPASHGERIVIRLLDKSARLYTLEELGMDPETLGRFRELISTEHGLVLVTGPTGSVTPREPAREGPRHATLHIRTTSPVQRSLTASVNFLVTEGARPQS